ncbi:hypothetical protein SCAB_61392, partial [Streptomyces scabiei 87.22]
RIWEGWAGCDPVRRCRPVRGRRVRPRPRRGAGADPVLTHPHSDRRVRVAPHDAPPAGVPQDTGRRRQPAPAASRKTLAGRVGFSPL